MTEFRLLIAVLCAVALLAACAPLPHAPVADGYPRSVHEVSGPAVLALLDEAHSALSRGRSEQAVASIERALRIEPRNPFLWQALAGTHLYQNLPDQAESTAQKSNSLARGNPYVEIENWRLIALARQARGDPDGARQAEAQADALRHRIGK
jgi:tetratricopeptide (TPR) repeat protein